MATPAAHTLITLAFSPLSPGSQILVRAVFFRICADSTLRGPESTLVATYASHLWRLGARTYREFHSHDLLYLRVTNPGGDQERFGPYESVSASEGRLFASGRCLGMFSSNRNVENVTNRWNEVTLLSASGPHAVPA